MQTPFPAEPRQGYINKSGGVIIPAQYYSHTAFASGRAWVSSGGFRPCDTSKSDTNPVQNGYIDRSGRFTATTCEEWSTGRRGLTKTEPDAH
ncbi:MAG: WG repeat-containing protein [Acidobacteriaceae bacterium]|nr:WG repeat-containing protein [Acidobacteriaceae bacterium]